MKQRNYVHKHSGKFNRPAVHLDQKKEDKRSPKVRDQLRRASWHDWRMYAE